MRNGIQERWHSLHVQSSAGTNHKKGLKVCTLPDEDGNQIQTTDGIQTKYKEHSESKLNSTILPDPTVLYNLPVIAANPSPPSTSIWDWISYQGLKDKQSCRPKWNPTGVTKSKLRPPCWPIPKNCYCCLERRSLRLLILWSHDNSTP